MALIESAIPIVQDDTNSMVLAHLSLTKGFAALTQNTHPKDVFSRLNYEKIPKSATAEALTAAKHIIVGD